MNDLTLIGNKDTLYEDGNYPRPFEFNEDVADVFDDMVSRSVPMYKEVNRSILEWTKDYYQEGSKIYDIGCSTGTTIDLISRYIHTPLQFVGIDNSEAMLEKAKIKTQNNEHQVNLVCKDIIAADYNNISVAIMTYTMQFVSVHKRKQLLQKIFDGMNQEGILYLSEKVQSHSPEFQETITTIYENFKSRSGYSRSEIERKKEALENVLIPYSLEQLTNLLYEVGFQHVEPIMKWNNFTSLVAIKK